MYLFDNYLDKENKCLIFIASYLVDSENYVTPQTIIMAKQITPTTAKSLCDNYDTKYQESSKLIKKEDNRSSYIPLDELKNYIDYLESANTNIDGIRIYLGSYDAKEKENEDLTTVFLAPTNNKIDNTMLNSFNLGIRGYPPSKKYGE